MTTIKKISAAFEISDEIFADTQEIARGIDAYLNASPELRERWQRDAQLRRAVERSEAQPLELTLERLLARLGWSRRYAEHVVQSYCRCDWGYDGWERCPHAEDQELNTWTE